MNRDVRNAWEEVTWTAPFRRSSGTYGHGETVNAGASHRERIFDVMEKVSSRCENASGVKLETHESLCSACLLTRQSPRLATLNRPLPASQTS